MQELDELAYDQGGYPDFFYQLRLKEYEQKDKSISGKKRTTGLLAIDFNQKKHQVGIVKSISSARTDVSNFLLT